MLHNTLSLEWIKYPKNCTFKPKTNYMYGEKIRAFRIMRGFTQAYIAGKLNVAQNTYSKYESNGEKLSHQTLERIADVLGVSVTDITSNSPIIINNQNSNQGTQGIGHIEHFYIDQKELFEKIVASKDQEIERLYTQLATLMKLLEKLK